MRQNYRMPLEMHAIHFKKEYLKMKLAQNYDDGIMILVYFFEVLYSLVRKNSIDNRTFSVKIES